MNACGSVLGSGFNIRQRKIGERKDDHARDTHELYLGKLRYTYPWYLRREKGFIIAIIGLQKISWADGLSRLLLIWYCRREEKESALSFCVGVVVVVCKKKQQACFEHLNKRYRSMQDRFFSLVALRAPFSPACFYYFSNRSWYGDNKSKRELETGCRYWKMMRGHHHASPLPKSVVPRFHSIKVLGEGSFGKAVLVEEIETGRRCVVKQIAMGKLSSREQQETQQEATLLSTLAHPNIVSYIDAYLKQTVKG